MQADTEFRAREKGQRTRRWCQGNRGPNEARMLLYPIYIIFLKKKKKFFLKVGTSAYDQGRCYHQALTSQSFDSISFSAGEWLVSD